MNNSKIDRRDVEDILGLTGMQESMLFRYLSDRESKQFFEQIRLKLTGKINIDLFKKAWHIVGRTNEVLRSVFRWEKIDEPVQIILKDKELPVRVIDLSGEKKEKQPGLTAKIIEDDRNEPLELTGEPIRITLCIIDDCESEMVIAFHHILYDGWSSGIVLAEFLESYNRLSEGKNPRRLRKTKYKEFYKWYAGQDKVKQEEYWRNCLEGFDTRTLLPYDKNKPGDIRFAETYKTKVPRALRDQLDRCSREHNVTVSTLLYTAWGILLQTYNCSEDIIFGTVVSGRTPKVKGIDKTVGLFINTLPLRLTTDKESTVREVSRFIGNHLEERNNHGIEHSSLTTIKNLTGIGKDNNLFDSIVIIDNYPLDRLLNAKGSLGIRSYDIFEMTDFDLTLQILLFDIHSMEMVIHYNRELFELETVEGLGSHFLNILEEITADPCQKLSAVQMLSEEEKRRIVFEFNGPGIDKGYPLDKTIHGIIEDRVEQGPDNTAVKARGHALSYKELNETSNRLARLLGEYGTVRGTRVVAMFPRSIEMITAVLAIFKAGAVCIPLDVSYPRERKGFIIEESDAGFVLKPGQIPGINGRAVEIDYDIEKIRTYPTGNLEESVHVQPGDFCYIIYTSGSTGKPKGTLLNHRGTANHAFTKIHVLGITGQDIVVHNFSINFVASIWQILSPLFMGAKVLVYDEETEQDPYLQFQQAVLEAVTIIQVIPSQLKAFLFLLEEGKEEINLDCLRAIGLTGEEAKPFLVNRFYEKYPNIQLVDCYGQTECSDDILHYKIPVDTKTVKVPIGTPSLNTQVFVLNHHESLQPVGAAGELAAAGAGVANGYLNNPELTAEKFLCLRRAGGSFEKRGENPPAPPQNFCLKNPSPLYKTGDLGRWLVGGNVEFLGRVDHQVKIRGNRVELREIENYIIRYDGIKEAVVIAKENKEGEKNLYAFFVADREMTVPELRGYLLKSLPDYMAPGHFVRLEKLPVNPSGKIDRKALAHVETGEGISAGTEFTPPRNEFEKKIAEIWRQLLEKEKIGTTDNFFDLGGHSLLLIKLKSKLEKTFNEEISIVQLFNYPTIERQAQYFGDKFKGGEKTGQEDGEEKTGRVDAQNRDIAVIGMVLRVPGAGNMEEFWQNIINGVESISFFREGELEGSEAYLFIQANAGRVPAGGVIGDIDVFDAEFFGFNPGEAAITDPQQRMFLEYAWMALEDAGYVGDRFPGGIGVYAGTGWNTYLLNNVLTNPEAVRPVGEFQAMIGSDKDFLATRISYKLNLKGPAFTVQTACSTSLVAVHLARRGLLNRECDMALAGGVVVRVPERTGYFYNEGGHLSPDGHCRTFDARAKGTVFGSGIGIVVLKRLEGAIEDNDHIYAIIKGSAINNDGSLKVGFTSPGEQGQAEVVLKALQESGIDPGTIGYIETHGTGTVLGDPVEISALSHAFKEYPKQKFCGGAGGGFSKEPPARRRPSCVIGSVKANVGHLDAAAGVIGLIKAILCLKHKQIPPSIHVETLNPVIDFTDSPFTVNFSLRDWESGGAIPRRAAVSSLGIGGTNAHVVLEEGPAAGEGKNNGKGYRLFLLSAVSESALDRMTDNLADHLKKHPGIDLADAAYTLQVGRARFGCRRMVLCSTGDVNKACDALTEGRKIGPFCLEAGNKPVIFMFPGQGSQYVDMGLELYENEPGFREEMDRCFKIIRPVLGYNIKDILYPPPVSPVAKNQPAPDINSTEIAQPLLFIFEYALAKLLITWGIKPYAMTGHSIGEYVAACLSGVLSLEHALKLVASRGKLMQKMSPGAMLSISASEKDIVTLLEGSADISLAAVNSSSLCVVSGPFDAIDRFEKVVQRKGYGASRLHTSHAFHSPMMDPVLTEFEKKAGRVRLNHPTIPYISNLSGTWITKEEASSSRYWVDHLRKTVRFSGGIEKLLEMEAPVFIEVGPGKVLSTFVRLHTIAKKDDSGGPFVVDLVRPPKKDIPDLYYLLKGIGQLWLYGIETGWESFHAGEKRGRIPLPAYPFERERHWLEPGQDGNRDRQAVGAVRNIGDWFYVPAWKQSMPPFKAGVKKEDNTWLVFIDDSRLQRQLPEHIKKNRPGTAIVSVKMGRRFEKNSETLYTIDPGKYEDYLTLLQGLRQLDKPIDTIVHLWLLGSPSQSGDLERGVYSLFYLAKAMGKQSMFDRIDLRVVGNRLHNIEKSDVCSPAKAAVSGPCKVISQEYPNIVCRLIDLDIDTEADTAIQNLSAELDASPEERMIAYRGSNRWVQSFEPAQLPGPVDVPPRLREQGVYLITGGLGNIGQTLAQYLAQTVQVKLILTGRSVINDTVNQKFFRGSRGAIFQKSPPGRRRHAEIITLQADVSDKAQMEKVIKQIEDRFGALHGVIHAAGIMDRGAFKPVADLEKQDCQRHFKPKIQGLEVLAGVLEDRDLDFCILTSSLSSILGGLGFYAYSAANAFMDAFARNQKELHGKNWTAVNWDEWRFADIDKGPLKGLPGITAEEGKETFKRALFFDKTAQVVVSKEDLQRRLLQWVSAAPAGAPDVKQAGSSLHKRPHLQSVFEAPASEVEKITAVVWQELLSIDSIGVHDDFFELGGHSLLATKLASRLRGIFRVELPLSTLFDKPTIREMAAMIGQYKGGFFEKSPPLTPQKTFDLEKIEEPGPYRLSFGQRRIWFLQQFDPGSAAYNDPAALRIEGPLNVPALERTLNEIARRHRVLQMNFIVEKGQPVQVFHENREIKIDVTVLQSDAGKEKEEQVREFVNSFAGQPFDLANDLLVRAALLKIAEEDWALVVNIHHMVMDGWSKGLMLKELMALYEAFSQNKPSPLEEPPVQYTDYVRWHHEWLRGELVESQLAYWKKQLAGAPPVLEFPFDYPRPAVPSGKGSLEGFSIPAEQFRAIEHLARREDVTLFMVLTALFNVLLFRYSGSEDIPVGTPIAGRRREELENLIGLFVNTLVLRTDLSGNPTFKTLLRHLRTTALAAYSHQDIPFEKLVEELNPKRNLNVAPLFQVMFQLQNAPMPPANISGLTITPIQIDTGFAQVDLSLTLWEENNILKGTFEYNADLFESLTIKRMAGHFRALFDAVIANAEEPISHLSMLTQEELRQLLVQWNDTAADYPGDLGIYELFQTCAAKNPNEAAVISRDGQMTYSELDQKAGQIAHALAELHAGPETLVAICMENSLELIAGIIGILKTGAAYIPLDPAYPDQRLTMIINDARPTAIVTRRVIKSFSGVQGAVFQKSPLPAGGKNTACVIYTSGSTGEPKGVLIENRSIVNLLYSFLFSYKPGPGDRILPLTSIASASFVGEILPILISGGGVVLAGKEHLLDMKELTALLSSYHITILSTVPSMIARLNAVDWKPETSKLRLLLSGGEALSAGDIDRLQGSVTIVNGYGLTEATICSTYIIVNENKPDFAKHPVISVGKPIINTQVYILDKQMGPVPIGVPGEIYIGGDGLSRGYLNRPKLKAERFVNGPRGKKIYKTGDLGCWLPDGTIKFFGRIDTQVQVHGHRIELSEIETHLGLHPAVRDVVVIDREIVPGDKRLVAYIAAGEERDEKPGSSELRDWLEKRIPDYMIPAVFEIIESIPLNINGKVDIDALPIPSGDRPELDVEFKAPETGIEREIASVWQEFLHVDKIGINDNFFDLGGHSLLLTEVHSRLSAKYKNKKELTIVHMFRYPTIFSLAAFIDDDKDQKQQNVDTYKKIQQRGTKQRQVLKDLKRLRRPGGLF